MKQLKNNNGSVAFLGLLLLLVLIACGVFSFDEYRVAIADDIESGKLIQTEESKRWLDSGDKALKVLKISIGGKVITSKYDLGSDSLWQTIFYAKVCFERARLEMEMKKKE